MTWRPSNGMMVRGDDGCRLVRHRVHRSLPAVAVRVQRRRAPQDVESDRLRRFGPAIDRYPPFTLAEADYPATLTVEYPWLPVKSWLLAKSRLLARPHWLVVGVLSSACAWNVEANRGTRGPWGGGLIGLLVPIAGVAVRSGTTPPRSRPSSPSPVSDARFALPHRLLHCPHPPRGGAVR